MKFVKHWNERWKSEIAVIGSIPTFGIPVLGVSITSAFPISADRSEMKLRFESENVIPSVVPNRVCSGTSKNIPTKSDLRILTMPFVIGYAASN
jgi:hypothetical protein